MYSIVKQLLFQLEPEKAHQVAMDLLMKSSSNNAISKFIKNSFEPKNTKPIQLWDLTFKNIVGLGAGFDKNAAYISGLSNLGFGFIEVGTVTPKPQNGNAQPRLFRLKKDEALINRMGFNNNGIEALKINLQKANAINNKPIIGINIGKNKDTTNEDAPLDYLKCIEELYEYGDYFVINVSSPNTAKLRDLQNTKSLELLINPLQHFIKNQQKKKPLLIKIAPDLHEDNLHEIAELALSTKLDGLIVSNTSIDRNNLTTRNATIQNIGNGGLSGKPIIEKANTALKIVANKTQGRLPIIASGGIMNIETAQQKIDLGAALIQIWTGFIYKGPSLIKEIAEQVSYC